MCIPTASRLSSAARQPLPASRLRHAHATNAHGAWAPQIAIRMDQQCKVLCAIKSLNKGQAKAFQKKIDDDYRVNMWVSRMSALRLSRVGRQSVSSCVLELQGCAHLLADSKLMVDWLCRRILDNLPVAMVRMREGQGEAVKTYERGFPVGRIDVRAAGSTVVHCSAYMHGFPA